VTIRWRGQSSNPDGHISCRRAGILIVVSREVQLSPNRRCENPLNTEFRKAVLPVEVQALVAFDHEVFHEHPDDWFDENY
jgi:hypothetical protein